LNGLVEGLAKLAGNPPAVEVLDVGGVGLEDLVGEGDDHIIAFGFEVAECEVGVGGEDDRLEHVCDFGLDEPLLHVVLEDVLEGHHGLRELLGGALVVVIGEMVTAEVAALLRYLPLAEELLFGRLLLFLLQQLHILVLFVARVLLFPPLNITHLKYKRSNSLGQIMTLYLLATVKI
jgi:hypothetical protein